MGEKAGLNETSHLLSDDAGNVTMFFRKAKPDMIKSDGWFIAGNADRIIAAVQGHTNLKHT